MMKFVHITYQSQYADAIERILARQSVEHYVRHPEVEGRDRDGRHFGSQVYPGTMDAVHALVNDEGVDPLLEALRKYRDEKRAHGHVVAAVIPVDKSL